MPNEKMREILAILNNASDLITVSNERRMASDVVKAASIYGQRANLKIPEEEIRNFQAILLDSRPITLQYAIKSIARKFLSLNN